MSEKTDWELVDTPQSGHKGTDSHHGSQGGGAPQHGSPSARFMQTLLGRWWQLKLLGAGIVAVVALALLIMIGGVLLVTVSLAAIVSLGIAKLVSWLRGKQLGHNTHLSTHQRNPWQR